MPERYFAKVVKGDGCWSWPGKKNRQGYGVIRSGTRKYGTLRETRIHRLSWEIHNGPIPDGLCVLHRCDNPECSNPEHLFLGTAKENNADRAAKGRSRPAKNRAKLSPKKVRAIRELSQMGMSKRWLAVAYGVCEETVALIRRRETWGDVV